MRRRSSLYGFQWAQLVATGGNVSRTAFATVPVTVEYALTPLGETLVPVLAAVRDWVEEHIGEVLAARRRAEESGNRQARAPDPLTLSHDDRSVPRSPAKASGAVAGTGSAIAARLGSPDHANRGNRAQVLD